MGRPRALAKAGSQLGTDEGIPGDRVVAGQETGLEAAKRVLDGLLAMEVEPLGAVKACAKKLPVEEVVKLVVGSIKDELTAMRVLHGLLPHFKEEARRALGQAYLRETGLSPVGIALFAKNPKTAAALVCEFGVDTWIAHRITKGDSSDTIRMSPLRLSFDGIAPIHLAKGLAAPLSVPCSVLFHHREYCDVEIPWLRAVGGDLWFCWNNQARFNNLTHVGGTVTLSHSNSVSFDSLEKIGGALRIEHTMGMRFPELAGLGGYLFRNALTQGLELPKLPAPKEMVGV